MARAENYFAWQTRLAFRELGARIVEVGCGIGNVTGLLLDREVVVAIDSEPACLEVLRRRYPGRPNLHVFDLDAAGPALAQLARFRPDSFLCLNVLEHIADDRRALASMAAILQPGGIIVLLVPAFECLYGPVDNNLGHYRRYTRRSLAALAREAGLDIRSMRYFNAVGFPAWWWNAHILRRQAQSDRQIAFFDRWVVPVVSRLESMLPPPVGQSLLAVLRKPAPR